MNLARKTEGLNALQKIHRFIGLSQRLAVRDLINGEEGEFFVEKMIELEKRIATMPKTYEQDGKGDEAIAYLHYFVSSYDCWVTEKDKETEQLQAFGLAKFDNDAELGYISLEEILANGAELDFHFEPCTLRELKSKL